MINAIIILYKIISDKKITLSTWGSLTDLCESYGFPYHTLKKEKYPFNWNDYYFEKIPYKLKRLPTKAIYSKNDDMLFEEFSDFDTAHVYLSFLYYRGYFPLAIMDDSIAYIPSFKDSEPKLTDSYFQKVKQILDQNNLTYSEIVRFEFKNHYSHLKRV